jgi:hypothetical protein
MSAIAFIFDRLPVPCSAKDELFQLHFSLPDTFADPIVLGNFNHHYPSWVGQQVRPSSESKYLISMYNTYPLCLLLLPGTITREETN